MQNVYSVSQVNTYIKNMFSQDYMLRSISVKGEVSNCKYHSFGHIYFTLKDKLGVISCVMFAGNRGGLSFPLKEGMQVVVSGNIDVYERDGRYQLYAKKIVLDGIGQLYERYEALKQELEERGLFAEEYKQPIPQYIHTLGVVTAKTGAAVRDIINIAKRRNPYVQIIVYPAIVQGEYAVPSIVNGIHALEQLGVDVMIVGRGGGSIEDLWAFNDEKVAYSIYHSEIPVISAVGHEPDVTISDYVADLRAATPSNAAELAVPDQDTLRQSLDAMSNAMASNLSRQVKAASRNLQVLAASKALRSPTGYLELKKQSVSFLKNRLIAAQNQNIAAAKHRYISHTSKLEAMSPLKVLTRGYSMAQTERGEVVRSVNQVTLGERIRIRLSDGTISATVMNKEEGK